MVYCTLSANATASFRAASEYWEQGKGKRRRQPWTENLILTTGWLLQRNIESGRTGAFTPTHGCLYGS